MWTVTHVYFISEHQNLVGALSKFCWKKGRQIQSFIQVKKNTQRRDGENQEPRLLKIHFPDFTVHRESSLSEILRCKDLQQNYIIPLRKLRLLGCPVSSFCELRAP